MFSCKSLTITIIIVCLTIISGVLRPAPSSAITWDCLTKGKEDVLITETIPDPKRPGQTMEQQRFVEKDIATWNPFCLFKITAEETGYKTEGAKLITPESMAGKLGTVLGRILSFLGIIFVALIIYGGFLWMTARGNEEQAKKAKNILRDAIIGVFIVLLSGVIMYFIMALPPVAKQV